MAVASLTYLGRSFYQRFPTVNHGTVAQITVDVEEFNRLLALSPSRLPLVIPPKYIPEPPTEEQLFPVLTLSIIQEKKSISATAELFGFSEFIASSPPRYYKSATYTGHLVAPCYSESTGEDTGTRATYDVTGTSTMTSQDVFSSYATAHQTYYVTSWSGLKEGDGNLTGGWAPWWDMYGVLAVSATVQTINGNDAPHRIASVFGPTGYSTIASSAQAPMRLTLSAEDTEADAWARAVPPSSWDAISWGAIDAYADTTLHPATTGVKQTRTGRILSQTVSKLRVTCSGYYANWPYVISVAILARPSGSSGAYSPIGALSQAATSSGSGAFEAIFDVPLQAGYQTGLALAEVSTTVTNPDGSTQTYTSPVAITPGTCGDTMSSAPVGAIEALTTGYRWAGAGTGTPRSLPRSWDTMSDAPVGVIESLTTGSGWGGGSV